MKISCTTLCAVAIAGAASFSQAASQITPPPNPTPFPGTSITVYRGQGIEPATENSPSVYLDIFPASAAPGAASPGALAVTLNGSWPKAGNTGIVGVSFRPAVHINIYSIGINGSETLVATAKDLPAAAAKTPGGPVVYTLRLDNKLVFPSPLQSGNYRAEALVMLGKSPVIPNPVYTYTEAGGAALNFKVSSLHITTLASISGRIQASVNYTARNPGNWAAVKAAGQQILDSHAGEIRKWISFCNAAVPGAPSKISVSSAEVASPGSFVTNINGQVYGERVAAAMDNLKKLVAAGNRVIAVPGGTVMLSTAAPVNIAPVLP